MTNREIDLLKYRGNKSTLFTGRPQGEAVREELNLNTIDKSTEHITFKIPKGTTSFNPSFYLGLLYESIKNMGIEKFDSKYSFIIEDENQYIIEVLKENLEDGKRNAINTLENKTGFKRFFNK